MTPPEAKGRGSNAETRTPPAVSFCSVPVTSPRKPEVLRLRSDFLRAAQARRQSTQGFMLQARDRGDSSGLVRVGYTCSKKLGNAVARNRAKRRLREIARALLPQLGHAGWDYVLVGRPKATAEREFAALLSDLETALRKVHAGPKPDTSRMPPL